LTETATEPVAGLRPARRRWRWIAVAVLVAALAGGGYVAVRLSRPVPVPRVVQTVSPVYVIPGSPPVLPWPSAGQAVVDVDGVGRLGSSGGSRPVPIASVAKVMTAYLLLRHHPLAPNEDGPTMTVTAEDAAAYPAQLASGQSLVPVVAGEEFTLRQALQALLLPSANNIAHILARWDAGSSAAFVAEMNQTAARLGMTNTRYTDPSGLEPATVSTAADQVVLGRLAMAVPAFAQIVGMPQATLPMVGPARNVNTVLGMDGIVGIKTGSTDEAGGCLLFAADIGVEGRRLRVTGAVFGPSPAMADAFAASRRLIQAAAGLVHSYRVVSAGQHVATVRVVMDRSTTLAATGNVDMPGWPGLSYRIDTVAGVREGIAAGSSVGTLQVSASGVAVTTALKTTGELASPSWWDRITHWW
jgi:serine-type D-Ala-D-Ala carboxypeptidase (penicillin-binding protein 5/6)